MAYLSEITELLTAILIGVLFSIFMSAVFILIIVLHRKTRLSHPLKRQKTAKKDKTCNDMTIPEITMLKPVSPEAMRDSSETSVNEHIFESFGNSDDSNWSPNASTMISHCMAVLVNCRALTEKLTGIAMNMLDEWDPQMAQLVEVAKLITIRVDQLVSCMRAPVNINLLEARAASLSLAVAHMAIMVQYDSRLHKLPVDWITQLLNNIQKHIEMLSTSENDIPKNLDSMSFMNNFSNGHYIKTIN